MDESIEFSEVLMEDEEKGFQWRLTVSSFRNAQYISVRKYFLSFEGEWLPTKEGSTMPLTIAVTLRMFLGLSKILSEAEIDEVSIQLKNIVKEYKENVPF